MLVTDPRPNRIQIEVFACSVWRALMRHRTQGGSQALSAIRVVRQASELATTGAPSSARRSLDKLADLFLDGGRERLQGKGGWPDVPVVEVCSVLETERRVSRLELLPALEEADNLAVLGIRRHPVPGFR